MDNLSPQLNTQGPKQPGFPIQSTPPPPVPEAVAQPQQPKKKPILKIFTVLAVFLFLVLASELAYYFFTTKRREAGQEPLTAQIPEQLQPGRTSPTPTPTPPEEEDVFGGALNLGKIDEIIGLYTNYTKPVYQKGEVTLVSIGKVIEVVLERESPGGNITSFSMRMLSETIPTEDFGIRVSENPEDFLTVYIVESNGQRNQASLEDIKEGDKLKITQTFNILDKQVRDLTIIEVERGSE